METCCMHLSWLSAVMATWRRKIGSERCDDLMKSMQESLSREAATLA